MDRWKAGMGRVREKRRVEERRSEKRKGQKKEDADARKGRKVAKHCVFPMIWGSGGSKSRLAKAAGAEPSGEQLHAVVARSTFRSQNVQNTSAPDHFWKLRCRKSARRCGGEAHFEVKMYKAHQVRTTFGSWDVEKGTPLWGEAHFEVKMYKAHHVRATFGSSDVVSRGRRKGLCTFSKVSKTWGFCSISKNDGRRGDIWRGSAKMHFAWQGGPGSDFLRGVAFWSIRSSGLLRLFCVTGAALRMTWHHFSWQAQ